MNPANPVQTFLNEAEDLLTRIEEIALELAPNEKPGELINQLFRAFHTVKGSGAMFGFDTVAAFTHHVETALDQVREGRLALSEELIKLILRSKDQIKALLDAATTGHEAPVKAGEEIVSALAGLLSSLDADGGNAGSSLRESNGSGATAGEDDGPQQTYQIHFRPAPDLMASGTSPAALLDELRQLGDCDIVANIDKVPSLDLLQTDQCYLAWDITLATKRPANTIRDVFIFVEDCSEISIGLKEGPVQVPETVSPGISTAAPANTGSEKRPPRAPAGASSAQKSSRDASVRVPSERLDRLVNLVGELVMNQSS